MTRVYGCFASVPIVLFIRHWSRIDRECWIDVMLRERSKWFSAWVSGDCQLSRSGHLLGRRVLYIYAWCKLRLLRRELTYCIRVWKISAIVIVVVCVSYMYVQRSSDSCKYGHNRSAHSIWWVCLTAWLKILQTGKNRARPIIMSRHIFAAVYRAHRSC